MTAAITIILGTLVSEDLACIAAGQLVASGQMSAATAIIACSAGIYLGDMGLWLVGRLAGEGSRRWKWLARRLPEHQFDRLGAWLDRRGAVAVVIARFAPGLRLPTYLAAGALGRRGAAFALWTFLAAAIWTPIIVLAAAAVGDRASGLFAGYSHGAAAACLFAAISSLLALRATALVATPIGRCKLHARVSKLWRWEFWPAWLFYAPVAVWIGWLAVRYRGFWTPTAANPGMPHGGVVGESKYEILRNLRSPHVIEAALIEAGGIDARLARLRAVTATWTWPIILKPDVGQRGAGVRLIRTTNEAAAYLASTTAAVIAQPFHPGPFEAGVFYYRFPGRRRGRVFSITDKHFPEITGDGESTVEELIWRHPRYRMQAARFLERHRDRRNLILAAGQTMPLAIAGNHCQGTMFRDGAHLITPQLEEAIDRVARTFDGFHFGRFDVRYHDVDTFRRGMDFAIIELNGVTSESTNLYDPSWSLWRAYRQLMCQWRLAFAIGALNRRRGARPSGLVEMVRAWRAAPRVAAGSD